MESAKGAMGWVDDAANNIALGPPRRSECATCPVSSVGSQSQTDAAYVLITAARDEARYIELLLGAVVGQTVLPQKWIIVSDGSVDGTDAIVKTYASRYSFIELLRMDDSHNRDFASKSYAINAAARLLSGCEYRFLGHLDADVSFDPTYMSEIFERFSLDPDLGVAGGFIYEKDGDQFKSRPGNTARSVAGAVQMFRRECYEAIGEFLPLSGGGEDWCAEVGARMNGWRVLAFPELKVYHHRPTGSGFGPLQYWYRHGRSDYLIGVHPLFEALKMVRRLVRRPIVAGALAQFWGFVSAGLSRKERIVSADFVRFLRSEQLGRLGLFCRQGRNTPGTAPLTGGKCRPNRAPATTEVGKEERGVNGGVSRSSRADASREQTTP